MVNKIKIQFILLAAGIVNFSSAGLVDCLGGCFDFARETRNYARLSRADQQLCGIIDDIGTEFHRIFGADYPELSVVDFALVSQDDYFAVFKDFLFLDQISLKDLKDLPTAFAEKTALTDGPLKMFQDFLKKLKPIARGSAKAKIIEHQLKTAKRLDLNLQVLLSNNIAALVEVVIRNPSYYPDIVTPAFLRINLLNQYLKDIDSNLFNFLFTCEDEDLEGFVSHLPAIREMDKSCLEFSQDNMNSKLNSQYIKMHLMPLLELTKSVTELIYKSVNPSVTTIVVKNGLDGLEIRQQIGIDKNAFLDLIRAKILVANNSLSSVILLTRAQKEVLQEIGVETAKASFIIERLENGELHLQRINWLPMIACHQ